MVQVLTLPQALAQRDLAIRIDVRSPAEFARGHIPGALNMPLFSDEERHRVGLCYAQEGKNAALKLGLDIVGPRLSTFIEELEKKVGPPSSATTVQVYCWRGGMRSASMAWLFDTSGWKVQTIVRGYKAWRGMVQEVLERKWSFVVLSGHTGCGKTKVLHEMQRRGLGVVDLEALAGHKGSAFGWLGEEYQPSQEHFDNLLAHSLLSMNPNNEIWLEDESRRIGSINLSAGIWHQLQAATVVRLHIPKEERIANLVADYGAFSVADLDDGIQRISQRLGSERSTAAREALAGGNISEAVNLCLFYYDKYYQRGMDSRKSVPAVVVECSGLSVENQTQLILDRLREWRHDARLNTQAPM